MTKEIKVKVDKVIELEVGYSNEIIERNIQKLIIEANMSYDQARRKARRLAQKWRGLGS